MAEDERRQGLLAWQWALYPSGHKTRVNLLIHVLTVPLFQLGTLALFGSLARGPLFAIIGGALMVGAMAAQGHGHATEPQAPTLSGALGMSSPASWPSSGSLFRVSS